VSHSLPGISLKLFDKIFNKDGLDTTSSIESDFLFRSAYFGGRCEVFGNPSNDDLIYHFDYTGMYSQVMMEEFNFGKYEIIKNPEKLEHNGFYFIYAFSNNIMPILPQHSDSNSKLLFTNGYIKGLY